MRVKLSYTVEEEDVLAEAAKLVSLSADDMQQIIGMFNDVQTELKGEKDEDKVVNVNKCLEMVEEFRKALFNLDTRLSEVVEIIKGYDEYQRAIGDPSVSAPAVSPSLSLTENSEPVAD
jgi:regulator of sigma D